MTPSGADVLSFMGLFQGLDTAFGTGKGGWVKRKPDYADFVQHLNGEGTGIGIAPLRPDNTVLFAAIDLDEPDFKAALAMRDFLPGMSWIERSRSGNAHVWVFFKEPLEAWVAMGILKEAVVASGKAHVEVFPKNHDFAKVAVGNYINLPYHGDQRPVLCELGGAAYPLTEFLGAAQAERIDPEEWRKRARWLLIEPPERRATRANFGQATSLHRCAEYIIEHRDDNPLVDGHRNNVFFMLARCLTNWAECDHEEALTMMRLVNESSADPAPDRELRRILSNAERGEYTSTGCDDPLVLPYADPECKIAHPQ